MLMAGIRGKSGPPGNENAFRHGLTGISQRRVTGALTPAEQSIREEILKGLINDKGGETQISVRWESNQKARSNPKALHTLDGYKRGLVDCPVHGNQPLRIGRNLLQPVRRMAAPTERGAELIPTVRYQRTRSHPQTFSELLA
jgi:hypothetical protein